jgi:demethoxyubiquinone hydroxylase (CLK1/Coq7/Cat5 family)/predicted DCC family thiol-disulfide oxidoreductase YuxK
MPDTLASPRPPIATDAAPCVYYDGACPLCRAEIDQYRRAEGGDTLRWVDADQCTPGDLGADLDRRAALARLHVRRADGTLVQGAAAFAEIWSSLPRWAWLARLARLPGVLPLLDLGYAAFLRLRPLWRPARHAIDALPLALRRELRTDHAGETGAVMIYRGILAVARDPALRAFAEHHLATEQRHLVELEQAVPPRWRSRLLPLWRLSGWLTGALPACVGPRVVYATIEAVETFVDRHYADQVSMIDRELASAPTGSPDADGRAAALRSLQPLLESCRLDEVAHRDDAGSRWDGRRSPALALWRGVVARGSSAAVGVCRFV